MVKTVPVGKKRSFLRGFLLTVFTFGLYAVYWAYKAPREVHHQFELDHDGRDDAIVWLVIGLLIPFIILVYWWKAVENVKYVRDRLGFPRSLSGQGFVLLYVGSSLAAFALMMAGFGAMGLFATEGVGTAEPDLDALDTGFSLIMVGVLVSTIIIMYAFYRLQTDINGVWDAWKARMSELTTEAFPRGPPAPPGPPPSGPPL